MIKRIIPIIGLCAMLTACGTTPEERGVSGAGIGASAGAIVGAVTGLSVVQGAVLGAVAGGLTGAITHSDQIDLGEPAWKQSGINKDGPSVANTPTASKHMIENIQIALKDMGYDPGAVDGVYGQKTQQAIRHYQEDHNLVVDGQATPALLDHLKHQQS